MCERERGGRERGRERERERGREGERERERERQTDRDRDRQRQREREKETDRQRDRQTEGEVLHTKRLLADGVLTVMKTPVPVVPVDKSRDNGPVFHSRQHGRVGRQFASSYNVSNEVRKETEAAEVPRMSFG